MSDTIISGLTTLVAAFAGAWFAYFLSIRDRARDLMNTRVAAGNRAIFALMRHFNTLHLFKTQIIEPHRADRLRCLNMRPVPPLKEDINVDLDALTFLLETEHRKILGELMVANESVHTTIQAINERSRFHIETVQPLLVRGGAQEGSMTTPAAVSVMLGEAVFLALLRGTDQAIEQVDRTLAMTQKLARELRAALLTEFPGRTFIRFEPKDEQEA